MREELEQVLANRYFFMRRERCSYDEQGAAEPLNMRRNSHGT